MKTITLNASEGYILEAGVAASAVLPLLVLPLAIIVAITFAIEYNLN
jgi:hypothetical protein